MSRDTPRPFARIGLRSIRTVTACASETMQKVTARLQSSLFGFAIVASTAMASGALADTLEGRAQPGLANRADAPIVVAQNSVPAAAESPPGRIERPEGAARTASSSPDTPEPPSERAAAAAARAKRALADEEGGSSFEVEVPVQNDVVVAEDPTAATSPAVSQPVPAEQMRRTSASLQPPPQKPQAHPSATCIAGCY